VKFGIFSDLHMEFDRGWKGVEYNPEILPDVFYLSAGDLSPSKYFRNNFYLQFDDNIFYVDGNHDFYGSTFDRTLSDDALKTRVLSNGMTIAGATLWTDLSNYQDWFVYTRCLADYGNIDNMTMENYNQAHKKHLDFLLASNADIIVTHHTPSRFSIHPKYANEKSNPGFTTDLTDVILNMKKPPKLWVHGHTHESFDYMIGTTRVVCHPRGYPNERSHYENYRSIIMEIE